MLNDNQGYFWYSKRQDALSFCDDFLNGWKTITNYCQLDDGRIVRYSEMTHTDKYDSKWEDVVRLGHGTYHHTVVQ